MNEQFEPGAAPSSEAAKEAVKLPSILLMITGALDLLLSLYGLVKSTVGSAKQEEEMARVLSDPNVPPYLRQVVESSEQFGPFTGILGLALGGLIVFGALKMMKLQSRAWATAAAILVLVPCLTPCCCIGIPVGVWALIVLNKPEVKTAFPR